jgi:hypothetical protein
MMAPIDTDGIEGRTTLPLIQQLSLEFVWSLALNDVKAVLIQYLSFEAGIRQLGLELVSGSNRSDPSRSSSKDQVTLLLPS